MILIVDNYDSFVHNLARYVRQICDTPVEITRNDEINADTIEKCSVSAIILSPGPCGPPESGACVDLVKRFHTRIPILGICLGHQVIVQALNGTIVQSEQPMHGKSSSIFHHSECGLFQNVPSPFSAGRYHSLIADSATLPSELQVVAETSDGIIMAVQHRKHPVFGLQFHPESVLTEYGYQILCNFLTLAGFDARLPEKQAVV